MGIVSVIALRGKAFLPKYYSSEGKNLPIGGIAALSGNAYLMEHWQLRGKISPKQVLRLWKERLPLWKCCISPGKASWQLGVQAYHKVTSYNKPYIRDLLWEKNPGEWLPAWMRSSRKLSRRQASYRASWGAEISKILFLGLRLETKSGAECFFPGFSLISSQGQGPFTLQRD